MTENEKRKLKEIHLQRLESITKTRSKPLIENIKEAFANVPYPGDENLISTAEHRAMCDECEGLYKYFVGKTWQETLEHKSIGWLSHAQSFFLPLAWQYYLPAYLIQNINKQLFSSFYFEPENDPELFEFESNRIKLLNSWQCDVIIVYLEITDELGQEAIFYDNEAEALKTLNYWKENYRNALAKEKKRTNEL